MPREITLRRISAVLALIGIGVASYIAISDANAGAPSCLIGHSGGCLTVAQSKYSHILGVNVSVLGIVGYVLILLATFVPRDPGRLASLVLSLFGFGFSLYLTALELFVIDAICQWCVSSAVIMTLLMIVNVTRAVGYAGSDYAAGGGDLNLDDERDVDALDEPVADDAPPTPTN